jgi:hypothetical protein
MKYMTEKCQNVYLVIVLISGLIQFHHELLNIAHLLSKQKDCLMYNSLSYDQMMIPKKD